MRALAWLSIVEQGKWHQYRIDRQKYSTLISAASSNRSTASLRSNCSSLCIISRALGVRCRATETGTECYPAHAPRASRHAPQPGFADKHLRDRVMPRRLRPGKNGRNHAQAILGVRNAILLYILLAPRDNGKVFSSSMIGISQCLKISARGF